MKELGPVWGGVTGGTPIDPPLQEIFFLFKEMLGSFQAVLTISELQNAC